MKLEIMRVMAAMEAIEGVEEVLEKVLDEQNKNKIKERNNQ